MGERTDEPMLSRTERIAIGLFFVAAIAISIVIVGRLGAEPEEVVGPAADRPVVGADVARPVPVLEAIAVASEWAKVWRDDAWPILISAQFEYPLDSDTPEPAAEQGMVMVSFAAPKAGEEWPRLGLAVSRQTGSIYFEEELSSAVEPPTSIADLLGALPISAEQAFRVAEEVVGNDYREGCTPSRRQVQVVLDSTDHDAPTWVVVYFDQRERHVNDIVVRIDAQTGATDTQVRDDTSC